MRRPSQFSSREAPECEVEGVPKVLEARAVRQGHVFRVWRHGEPLNDLGK